MNITVNKIAQGIAFYNERPSGFFTTCPGVDVSQMFLEICEIRVMGEIQCILLLFYNYFKYSLHVNFSTNDTFNLPCYTMRRDKVIYVESCFLHYTRLRNARNKIVKSNRFTIIIFIYLKNKSPMLGSWSS